MDNIKQVGIVLIVIFLIIIGSAWYIYDRIGNYGDERYAEGQKSVSTSRIDTIVVRDTVRVSGKKPKPVHDKELDSQTVAFINELITDGDNLRARLDTLTQTKEFFVADTMGNYAIIRYFPPLDEYEGELVLNTLNIEVEKIKEPPPPIAATEEPWYFHPSIFIAGGATGILVVATGGTPLLGLGVTVAVSGAMAIF